MKIYHRWWNLPVVPSPAAVSQHLTGRAAFPGNRLATSQSRSWLLSHKPWPINNARHKVGKSERDSRGDNIHDCCADRCLKKKKTPENARVPPPPPCAEHTNTHKPSAWNLWWLALAELAETRMFVAIITETATWGDGQFCGCTLRCFARTTATRVCLSGPEVGHQLAVEVARLPNRDA